VTKKATPLAVSLEPFTRRMFTRIITGLSRSLREEELSVAQVATLYLLDEHGSRRMSEVAADLARPAPATSRMIDDLVNRRLLRRVEDPSDRRAKLLSLTPQGRAFVVRASEARMQTISETFVALPKEAALELLGNITRLMR
jgi:DNA-binding MarR family transcriptional regulator